MTDRKLPISLSDHSEFGINHGAAAIIGGIVGSSGVIGSGSTVAFGVGVGLPGLGVGLGGTTTVSSSVTGGGSSGNVSSKHAIARLKHTNSVSSISSVSSHSPRVSITYDRESTSSTFLLACHILDSCQLPNNVNGGVIVEI